MVESINVGLDLGSDTLKIAFAYPEGGSVVYGKLARNDSLTQIAIPAVAYYDDGSKTWLYGDEVEKTESSFVNVVKIKNLVSLLQRNPDENILRRNRDFYFNRSEFPKFYFPVKRKMLEDFELMFREDMTFHAEGDTPASVCEGFFHYAQKIVLERIGELTASWNVSFKSFKVAVVYPPKVGREYVNELIRLTKRTFSDPVKVLSSTKALGMFAYHRKALRAGESALVFDMGDEDISVAKVRLQGENIFIDGADGHSPPLPLGGTDVDEKVLDFVEKEIASRETVGTPSEGDPAHIYERGLHSKQYLLMKNIKNAKIVLSRPMERDESFRSGVPISVVRDLYIQRSINREEFIGCVGTSAEKGIAHRVIEYIANELRMPANRGVKKIFLSGGLTETYSLLEFIRRKLNGIEVCTFDDGRDDGDPFGIQSYEDSVYAPAVGGAIVALKNYDVPTVVTLSYGTWAFDSSIQKKVLSIFVEAGTPLKDGENIFLSHFNAAGDDIPNEEIFSIAITREEIRRRTVEGLEYAPDGSLIVGEKGSDEREKAEGLVGLKTVAGGENGRVYFYYGGKRVSIIKEGGQNSREGKIIFSEGISVDADGYAKPLVANTSEGKSIKIRYFDEVQAAKSNLPSAPVETHSVPANRIELRLEGLEGFEVANG